MKAETRRETATGVNIQPVKTSRDLRRFIDLPYHFYRDDPNWVPPLRIAQKDILNKRKHPFYKTSDAEMFLAIRDGAVVGRIMAILNRAHNEFHSEHVGFFGFFECENRAETARDLLTAATEWVRDRGAEIIRGPMNPSTNYECGLLIDGFNSPPRVMMTYNPKFYAELIEQNGFRKAVDLYAYDIAAQYFKVTEKLTRVANRLKQKDGISVRPVNMKEFDREVALIRSIYNDAWSRNWGFVPFSQDEFVHLAKDLKQLIDPRVVLIAERRTPTGEQKPIGFFLAVPDINLALKKIKDGRLLPFGLIKLLWHSRKVNTIRIITMGIVHEYQSLGAGSVFLSEIYQRGPAAGYPHGEMSWVLENNTLMNRAAELIGGRLAKTYRIYEKPATHN